MKLISQKVFTNHYNVIPLIIQAASRYDKISISTNPTVVWLTREECCARARESGCAETCSLWKNPEISYVQDNPVHKCRSFSADIRTKIRFSFNKCLVVFIKTNVSAGDSVHSRSWLRFHSRYAVSFKGIITLN